MTTLIAISVSCVRLPGATPVNLQDMLVHRDAHNLTSLSLFISCNNVAFSDCFYFYCSCPFIHDNLHKYMYNTMYFTRCMIMDTLHRAGQNTRTLFFPLVRNYNEDNVRFMICHPSFSPSTENITLYIYRSISESFINEAIAALDCTVSQSCILYIVNKETCYWPECSFINLAVVRLHVNNPGENV